MSKIYANDIGDKELHRLHECMLEILDAFVDICEENGLKYYLFYGTLLGAIRHQGFIPWDDDMDVVMPREDYEKFQQIVSDMPETRFYFQCCENDPKYWAMFGKYRKRGTEINEQSIKHLNVDKAIYIDIFPLDNTSLKNKKAVLRSGKTVKLISRFIETKIGIGSTYNRLDKKVVRFLLKPFSIKTFTKIRHKIMIRENNQDNNYYVGYDTTESTEKVIFPKDYFGEGLVVPFENRKYRIPEKWEQILLQKYGNYMQLPPEDQRKMTHKPVYIDFGE